VIALTAALVALAAVPFVPAGVPVLLAAAAATVLVLRARSDSPGDSPSGTHGDSPGNAHGGSPSDSPSNSPGGSPGGTPSNCPGDSPAAAK
jgi:hypothetical protein